MESHHWTWDPRVRAQGWQLLPLHMPFRAGHRPQALVAGVVKAGPRECEAGHAPEGGSPPRPDSPSRLALIRMLRRFTIARRYGQFIRFFCAINILLIILGALHGGAYLMGTLLQGPAGFQGVAAAPIPGSSPVTLQPSPPLLGRTRAYWAEPAQPPRLPGNHRAGRAIEDYGPGRVAGLAQSDFKLIEAYDCGMPKNVYDVHVGDLLGCAKPRRPVSIRNVTYQLLQKEMTTRVAGWSCSLRRSQTAFYCGVYDHQTYDPENSYTHNPATLADGLCAQIVSSLEYVDETGGRHAVKHNTVNTIRYPLAGSTLASGGELSCVGQPFRSGGQVVERMVVTVELELVVQAETFISDEEGQVRAQGANVRLPCPLSAQGCQTALISFAWRSEDDHCPLAVARKLVRGQEVTADSGEQVFLSTDGSLIRLVLDHTVSLCGRIVLSTNYENFYLYAAVGHEFTRMAHPTEYQTASFAANLDDYLYDHISTALTKEFNGVLAADCEDRLRQEKHLFWSQLKDPGLTTYILGNGSFASGAGEVLYHYQCQPVVVRARSVGQCYEALPVEPVTQGSPTVQAAQAGLAELRPVPTTAPPSGWRDPPPSQDHPTLFIEPLTHRLTRFGILTPCSEHFQAKYKNAAGDWVAATPSIQKVPAPKEVTTLMTTRTAVLDPIDWTGGGLYDPRELNSMERFLENERARDDLVHSLHAQTNRGGSGPINLSATFPHQGLEYLESTVMQIFAYWLSTIGGVCSIIVCIVLAVALGYHCFTCWAQIHLLRTLRGCGMHLLWVLFPGVHGTRQYTRDKRRRREAAEAASRSGEVGSDTFRYQPGGSGQEMRHLRPQGTLSTLEEEEEEGRDVGSRESGPSPPPSYPGTTLATPTPAARSPGRVLESIGAGDLSQYCAGGERGAAFLTVERLPTPPPRPEAVASTRARAGLDALVLESRANVEEMRGQRGRLDQFLTRAGPRDN